MNGGMAQRFFFGALFNVVPNADGVTQPSFTIQGRPLLDAFHKLSPHSLFCRYEDILTTRSNLNITASPLHTKAFAIGDRCG